MRRPALLLLLVPLLLPVVLLMAASMVVLSAGSGGITQADVPPGGVSGSQLREGTGIPGEYQVLIRRAVQQAGCPQLTESVLAAQLKQESGFSPTARSPVGAMGIAQFMPGTWPGWGRDENGNGVASPWEPEDAIPAAARFDCGIAKAVAGLPGDPAELMLAGYNAGPGAVLQYRGIPPYQETQNYVRPILDLARSWSEAPVLLGAGSGPAAVPDSDKVERTGDARVDGAVAWAVGQVGSWYQWGGSCTNPFGPPPGRCDCSSLMQQAYASVGVALPRVAADQSRVGAPVAPAEVRPGDLVAIVGALGTRTRASHIGMYVGRGWVVQSPYSGARVGFVPLRSYGDILTVRRIVSG